MSCFQKQGAGEAQPDMEANDRADQAQAEWRFNCANFWLVVLGGLAEFGNSFLTLMGLSFASEYGINAGIAGVLFPLSTVFVSIIARFAYEEHIQCV